MPDPASMLALLSGLKTATDIAKSLRKLDISLEKAEAKMQLADLISALADAKISAAETKLELEAREQQIRDLADALKTRGALVRRGEVYFLTPEDGGPENGPFCCRCWEVDHNLVHVNRHPIHFSQKLCPECKSVCGA